MLIIKLKIINILNIFLTLFSVTLFNKRTRKKYTRTKIIVSCNFLSAEYSSLIINIFLIDTTRIENFNNLILILIKLPVCMYVVITYYSCITQ